MQDVGKKKRGDSSSTTTAGSGKAIIQNEESVDVQGKAKKENGARSMALPQQHQLDAVVSMNHSDEGGNVDATSLARSSDLPRTETEPGAVCVADWQEEAPYESSYDDNDNGPGLPTTMEVLSELSADLVAGGVDQDRHQLQRLRAKMAQTVGAQVVQAEEEHKEGYKEPVSPNVFGGGGDTDNTSDQPQRGGILKSKAVS